MIEGEIGRGGTAIVYRARDKVRGIAVAIKLLREDAMSAVSVERFLLEIRQTTKLTHPHIVPVLDSGEMNGRPYFVLPYLDGGTLRDRLNRQKQLPFAEVIAIGTTIARALDFAHAQGVIHRDVKPENILFSAGQACLADFGTARALERAANDPTTSTGVVRGTAAYMSPEQASGEREYDGRTDIYSLACVLYECVAGIQPFVGPTMQAVISQRLSHAPRPASVYRPTVPVELEQVLAKATAMVPADRHQSGTEFASALERTPISTEARATPQAVRVRAATARRWITGFTLGVTVVVASLLVSRSGTWNPLAKQPVVDTTLVAITPISTGGNAGSISGQEMLVEGLRRWSGVTAVETFATNDAILRQSGNRSISEAAAGLSLGDLTRIARGLGAGRFIRAQVTSRPGQHSLYAALYDVSSGKDLYRTSVPLSADSSHWPEEFQRTIDSLMLRGARDARPAEPREQRSLPGSQSFLAARTALSEWDLPRAESLFRQANVFDSTDLRARLWLAQVRSWRGSSPSLWASLVRDVGDSSSLLPPERQQARALAFLGARDFSKSCEAYDEIVRRDSRSFVGWYGLGECRRLDYRVISDSTSPSGWRFESSYWRAIEAYSTAFRLLPSAYRAVQARSYSQLRQLLLTNGQLRPGEGAGRPLGAFLSRPAASGDTIAFVPYPREALVKGLAIADKTAQLEAVNRTRRVFQDIVRAWRVAFPANVAVREAFAVSLELLGDVRAAADSFHSARGGLKPDSSRWLRLGVQESLSMLKVALSGDLAVVPPAVLTMDSVLALGVVRDATDAEQLARIASVRGQCGRAATLARQAVTYTDFVDLPPSAVETAQVAIAQAAARCKEVVQLPEITGMLRRAGFSDSAAHGREYELIGAVAAIRFPRDSSSIVRMARVSSDYILRAQAALLLGHPEEARRIVAPALASHIANPGVASLDGVVLEATIAIALADTESARQVVDRALSVIQFTPPLSDGAFTVNQLRVGAFTQLMLSKAQLDRDPQVRSRWTTAFSTLTRSPPSVINR